METASRTFLRSLMVGAFVAGLAACTLTGLEAGFTLTPPGGYLKLASFSQTAPASQPVKIIAVEIPATTSQPSLDVPDPTGHDTRAVP